MKTTVQHECIFCGQNACTFDGLFVNCEHCYSRKAWYVIVGIFNAFQYSNSNAYEHKILSNKVETIGEISLREDFISISASRPNQFVGLATFIQKYLGLHVGLIQTGIDPSTTKCLICGEALKYVGDRDKQFVCLKDSNHFRVETVSAFVASRLSRSYPGIAFEQLSSLDTREEKIKVTIPKKTTKYLPKKVKTLLGSKIVQQGVEVVTFTEHIISIIKKNQDRRHQAVCVPRSIIDLMGDGILYALQSYLPDEIRVVVTNH